MTCMIRAYLPKGKDAKLWVYERDFPLMIARLPRHVKYVQII